MPFVKKIETITGIIGIWEITESAESLISAFRFSENEETEFKKFRFEKRQKEYLVTRLLLYHLLGEKAELIYHESGRPLLKNSKLNISISHSSDFVTVFISNELCGIDVENVHRNIDRVTKRFLNTEELAWINNADNVQILKILYWCAKEAIFKCSCHTGIQFDAQIFISPVKIGETKFFKGKLTVENRIIHYDLWYFNFGNNMVVYCVEDKNNSL